MTLVGIIAWLRKPPAPYVVVALLAAALLTLAYCKGESAGLAEAERETAQRTIELQERQASAADSAAEARVIDLLTLAEQEKELENARKTGAHPVELRARRTCIIMQQQGRPASELPSACGHYTTAGTSDPARSR